MSTEALAYFNERIWKFSVLSLNFRSFYLEAFTFMCLIKKYLTVARINVIKHKYYFKINSFND